MTLENPKFDFDTPIDRTKTNSIKWGSRTIAREGLTSLSVADMDFAMDEHILQIGRASCRERVSSPV